MLTAVIILIQSLLFVVVLLDILLILIMVSAINHAQQSSTMIQLLCNVLDVLLECLAVPIPMVFYLSVDACQATH